MSNTDFPSNSDAQTLLRQALPENWEIHPGRRQHVLRGVLGSVQICAPGGDSQRLAIVTAADFEPRDVGRIERLAATVAEPEQLFLIAAYLSPRSRELLKERGISHGDMTGTLWISTGHVFVDRSGAKPAPRSTSVRARSSLRGPLTGRIVRFLCDMRAPLKVRTIAQATAANAGNVSRLLELLEREKLIERNNSGAVNDVHWEALIKAWAPDLRKERTSRTFLEPRGVTKFTRSLANSPLEYAVTGSFAIAQLAPVAEPVAIELYVPNIPDGVDALHLRASDRIGNVTLIEAFDGVVFDRVLQRKGLTLAAPSQIAADALTLPRRSDEEFTALIRWMKHHEPEWRG